MSRPSPASENERNAFLTEAPGWEILAGRLASSYEFRDFAEAIEFMVRVAVHADRLDHHPDWSNVYRTVKVELVTHDVGAITSLDFELARAMDAEAAGLLSSGSGRDTV